MSFFKLSRALTLLLSMSLAHGCKQEAAKSPSPKPTCAPTSMIGNVTVQALLQSRCVSCHRAGTIRQDFSNEVIVRNYATQILSRTQSQLTVPQHMPPGVMLQPAELTLLQGWQSTGASSWLYTSNTSYQTPTPQPCL